MSDGQISQQMEGHVGTDPDSNPIPQEPESPDSIMSKEEGRSSSKPKVRRKPEFDASFSEFMNTFNSSSSNEDKIQLCIQYMRTSISQEGTPHFKEFWEA